MRTYELKVKSQAIETNTGKRHVVTAELVREEPFYAQPRTVEVSASARDPKVAFQAALAALGNELHILDVDPE